MNMNQKDFELPITSIHEQIDSNTEAELKSLQDKLHDLKQTLNATEIGLNNLIPPVAIREIERYKKSLEGEFRHW